MKRTAERVAELGYAALAADVWGDGKQLRDESEIGPTIGRFASDRTTWMGRLHAAHHALISQNGVDASKIAFIGYCFGGASVLEYLRHSCGSVRGVVSFHGGLNLVGSDWSSTPPGGKALILTGFEDPMADSTMLLDLQKGLTEADIDWEVDTYGHTKHGFTRPDSGRANRPEVIAYNQRADRRSWAAMCRFLEEIFSE
jgi:dienelactone hydrolase